MWWSRASPAGAVAECGGVWLAGECGSGAERSEVTLAPVTFVNTEAGVFWGGNLNARHCVFNWKTRELVFFLSLENA